MNSGIYRSRLGRPLDKEAAQFLSSIEDDSEIFLEDILGSEAHAIMLYEQRIIKREDLKKILKTLEEIKAKWLRGEISLKVEGPEDIHEFIESLLIDRVGVKVGGKLHIGRSRNDQVALDIRLRMRKYLLEIWRELIDLMKTILVRAEEEKEAPLILYTHLQHAQIGSISHYLLALFDHLLRDLERIENCYKRVNKSPLGASAIGGSLLPLNRIRIAELLGFEGIIENSVDAVSSRDFALESLSASSILMTFLSRVSEDFIIWSSSEFGYIELPDELASPSSIMPHKKNPCLLELVRAKAGKICGLLTASLMELKGTPIGYNRDLQEQKSLIFQGLKETLNVLKIFLKIMKNVEFKTERMLEAVSNSYASAIDLAENLVKYLQISIREAHMIAGEIVKEFVERGLKLKDLDQSIIKETARKILGKELDIPNGVLEIIQDPSKIPSKRMSIGAPNPSEVSRMIEDRKKIIEEKEKILKNILETLKKKEEIFSKTIKSFIEDDSSELLIK